MRSYRRASRKRAYYDPMSDSKTPMSQSELAAEAEAVFDIVFDEDPNALLQSGAYGKIFDYFKRYGISNDYSDAVDMALYIEENLLRRSHRANRKFSMQMDYGRKSFLDEQEIRDLAWEIFTNDPQYTDYSESDFGKLGRIEPNWIHDAIDKNVKRYLLEHNIPFHMANVSQISNLIVNNRIITYEKVDGGWLETRKSASRRANRKRAYYDDYIDPLINQGPTYPDYSHPDLNEWDYGTRDKVLSIIRDNPEVENAIKDVLRSGGNPRDVKDIFEDHFGWEGVAYDMLGEDWLSIADRYR